MGYDNDGPTRSFFTEVLQIRPELGPEDLPQITPVVRPVSSSNCGPSIVTEGLNLTEMSWSSQFGVHNECHAHVSPGDILARALQNARRASLPQMVNATQ